MKKYVKTLYLSLNVIRRTYLRTYIYLCICVFTTNILLLLLLYTCVVVSIVEISLSHGIVESTSVLENSLSTDLSSFFFYLLTQLPVFDKIIWCLVIDFHCENFSPYSKTSAAIISIWPNWIRSCILLAKSFY